MPLRLIPFGAFYFIMSDYTEYLKKIKAHINYWRFAPCSKLKMKNKINHLLQEKNIWLFIYGKPAINKEKYINFKYFNTDHIDFRIVDIE